MKKFFNIKNKCGMDLSQTEDLFHDLGEFAQERFGFKKPPTLNLISDQKNAQKPLGKTAYYDPQTMAITIYTDNRHTKDILRSLAHELVHHMQNELGMLNDSGYHGAGYAQKNKDLRQSEKQAYLEGNMCFRDWEDGLKESNPTIYNEWRIKTMSTKKWKNNELMENLSEKFGLKMDLKALNESSCGGKRKNEALGDGKIDPDDDEKAGLKSADPTKVSRGDVAAEKGGARGPGKKGEESEEESEEKGKSKTKKGKEPEHLRKAREKKKSMKESRLMKIIKQEIRKQLKETK